MLIAQISDMHICEPGSPPIGEADVIGNLERAVATINGLDPRPDIVLATGDLTGDGHDPEYAALRDIVSALEMPLYMIPGNHDRRDGLRAAFGHAGYLPPDGEFLHYVVDDYPVRIVAVDTVVPNAPHGLMDDERLAWLDATLAAAPARPTIVMMHHPPFTTGIKIMDSMRCSGGAAFGAVIEKHGQIERVLCGHVHRALQRHFHGTTAFVAPSTARQLQPLFRDVSLEYAAWSDEPPAFLLHLWREGEGIVTHLVQY